jgi:DASH complex subunit DAD3
MVEQLSTTLSTLSASPSSLTLDGLRLLERKTATVCTLLKASVYSIVLQQQIWNESEEDHQVRVQQEEGVGYGHDREGFKSGEEEGFEGEGEGDVSFG